MARQTRVKRTLRADDRWRALRTDTAPTEVPIVFSNDGLYQNVSTYKDKSQYMRKLMEMLILNNKYRYTIPYRYNIVKDSETVRQLSLLHPKSEVDVANFYGKFHSLICYYASLSPFSIRYPYKIGTRYYLNGRYQKNTPSEMTEPERDSILTEISSNPSTFFSLRRHQRLHQFFGSPDYIGLEKKFSIMKALDVSRCFDSMYTHTIAWALKSIKISKDHVSAKTFGNEFDRLMQSANYNETNGICVGPEVSRIFAEIILGCVDRDVEKELREIGFKNGIHYECRRYVDNYYLFSNEKTIINHVQKYISSSLRVFNLHINEEKTETLNRPFYTKNSYVIEKVNKSINEFADKFLCYSSDGFICVRQGGVKKPFSIKQYFINDVKKSCFEAGVGYDGVSNYVISALCSRLFSLIRSYGGSEANAPSNLEGYPLAIELILDVVFFFYTVHPTASASYRVAGALVSAHEFLGRDRYGAAARLRERALVWADQLFGASAFEYMANKKGVLPVEIVNIVFAVTDLFDGKDLPDSVVEKAGEIYNRNDYFGIISRLYIFRRSRTHYKRRVKIFEEASQFLCSEPKFFKYSQHVHLFFDLMSCPHVSVDLRARLMADLWPILKAEEPSLPGLGLGEFRALVSEIQTMPWFVQWGQIRLNDLIVRKQLSTVY